MNHDYPVQILGTVYAAYQRRGQVKNKHKRKDKDVKKIISISLALIAGLSTCESRMPHTAVNTKWNKVTLP